MSVRVGLVGYGNIGQLHHRVIDSIDGAGVTAVCRSSGPDVAGVKTYRDYEQMLVEADIDLVAVCTPSGLHGDQALSALKHDKHVVVEKPFALDLDSGAQVIEEADRRHRLLSVISQRRFMPHVVALKESLDRSELGRLVLGETLQRWRRDQAYYDESDWRGSLTQDGGVLMNQAIHAVDLLRWFMGPVDEVFGYGDTLTHRMEAEDCAVVALRFSSGALGVVSATTSMPVGVPAEISVIGDRGTVTLHGNTIVRWDGVRTGPPSHLDEDTAGGENRPMGMADIGHDRQWRDIISALTEGRQPKVTGEAGLASAAVVDAVYRSWRDERPIKPKFQHGNHKGAKP